MNGWMPVCDPSKNPLRGVRYKQEGSFLALRWDGLRLIYEDVPERVYEVLMRSAYAGAYFRKYVQKVYPCVDIKKLEKVEPYRPESNAPQEKLARLAKQRLEAVNNPERDLFGEAIGTVREKTSRRSRRS